MKKYVYSLRDSKAETFGQNLLLFGNKGEAIRSIQEAMKNPETFIGKYPEDFALFCLGEYDQSSGEMGVYEQKQHIIDLINLTETEK